MIPDSLVSTPPVLATQIPSQTIPPSVYPSYLPGRGISPYSDPLNHPSNSWEITSNCQFLNEMYHVRASEHEAYTICHQQANEFTDFAFEVQMKIVTGDCGGMVFRSEKSKYKFYRVDICSDGDMRVFLQGDSSLNPLFYKNITDIKRDPKKTHVVAIVAQGRTLLLYIDQKSIGQIPDTTYSNGQIGLAAYERSNPTEVAYMNVRIWVLKA